jgi:NTP pyrophosphatase (non-canonical NTP hydrolase)
MGLNYGYDGSVRRTTEGEAPASAVSGLAWIPEFNELPLTLRTIAAEVRTVNIEKGWRAPDGGMCAGHTFGDYIALAHSELSEALEAYRDHRLEDATETQPECSCAMSEATMVSCGKHGYDAPEEWAPKPEGVGSEFADLLIRLVDMADVFGIDLEAEYRRKIAYNRTRAYQHGGRTLYD